MDYIDYMDILVKSTNFNQNKTIRQIVYENLRKNIISGIIPVGERIIEKEYAERLNISRTPVREALRMLEIEELVEYVPRVGVVVQRISSEDAIEIFKIRHNLEILALTTAMDYITEEQISAIERLSDLAEQLNKEGRVEETIDLFGEFNSKMYEASGMKRLNGMISRLNEYLHRFRHISMADYEKREQAIREHREILKIVVEKNRDGIDNIVKRHLQNSLDVIIEEIRKNEKDAHLYNE
jgi:DNA-binding GntR family transcriptional regulator